MKMGMIRYCLNLKAVSWLFMVFTAVLPIHVYGAHSCQHVFAEEIESTPRVFYKRLVSQSLTESSVKNDLIKSQIAKLAESILHDNALIIKTARSYNRYNLTDYKVEEIKLLPGKFVDGYGLFIVKLYNPKSDETQFERIRSNGFAAFVDRSFQFRDNVSKDPIVKRFKAAYLDENGVVKSIDQGEVLISSLPDKIQLSRAMVDAERDQWVYGKPIQAGAYGARTHFAVNYFKFQNYEPYLIPYSKEQLLAAYRRGDVEINTYDAMPRMQMWRGKIDLEFEVVFEGVKSIETLRPLLQDSLKQGILPFE